MIKSNKNNKYKVVVIVGPTASGKSELAVKLAKKYHGEIISADSRQVYRGMDIGSGKVPLDSISHKLKANTYKGIPHHLIDVADPKKEYNVSHFVRDAKKAIKDISSRGKLPIICGGTGMWIDALIYGWQLPQVKPNFKLRKRLEKMATSKLVLRLKKIDPQRSKNIDKNNRRRVIRAVEIVMATGRATPPLITSPQYDAKFIGISAGKNDLDKKIYHRLIKRISQGMTEEVKRLHQRGLSWKRLDNFGLEYRYVARFLRGFITKDQMLDQLFSQSKKYAKRQMTWFKKNKEINWIPASASKAQELLRDWPCRA